MHGAWVLQSPEGGQLSGLDSRSSPRAAAAAIMNASPFGNGEAWQMIGPHAAFCADWPGVVSTGRDGHADWLS